MTEQITEALIAEAREMAGHVDWRYDSDLVHSLADRLEAVAKDSAEGQYQHAYWQQRAERAESWEHTHEVRVDKYANLWRAVERERDALAAVIEKVDDFVTRHYLDTRFGAEVLPILATAPAVVLRERDADRWDEAIAASVAWHQDQRYYSEDEVPNPYRSHACAEDDGRGEYCQACGQKREGQGNE